jgi:uncharacterized membrane protein YfcA
MINIPLLFSISFYFGLFLYQTSKNPKRKLNPYEIQWTMKTILLLCGFFFLAGILSSSLGSAMMRNIVLIEFGVDPLIASATCSFIVLFETSISSVLFFSHGNIPLDFSVLLFICGIFGSIIGQGILSKYLNKKLIVGILGVTIFVAAFLMFSQGVYQSVMDYIHYGSLLHIKSPCDAHS